MRRKPSGTALLTGHPSRGLPPSVRGLTGGDTKVDRRDERPWIMMMPSSDGLFQKKRLARRLVLTARAACDVQDLDAAFQVLQAAEILLRGTEFTAKDRRHVVGLIVGSHVVLWGLRHEARIDLLLASSLHVQAATLECAAGTTLAHGHDR